VIDFYIFLPFNCEREISTAGYISTCKNAIIPDDSRYRQQRREVEDKLKLTG